MEKRAYTRQPLLLDAQVVSADGSLLLCKVRDFCLGGLFLTPQGTAVDDLPVAVNDSVSIEFAADTQGNRQAFRLQARVAGLFKGGMGVEFKAPDPAALVALQTLASHNRGGRSSDQAGVFQGDASQIIEQCHTVLSAFLTPRVESLQAIAENKLFIASRDAESNMEQTEYLDAMKELEQIHEPVHQQFLAEILGHMKHLGEPRAALKEPSNEDDTLSELSLVDSGEFADWLAAKAILTKAEPQPRRRPVSHRGALLALGGHQGRRAEQPGRAWPACATPFMTRCKA